MVSRRVKCEAVIWKARARLSKRDCPCARGAWPARYDGQYAPRERPCDLRLAEPPPAGLAATPSFLQALGPAFGTGCRRTRSPSRLGGAQRARWRAQLGLADWLRDDWRASTCWPATACRRRATRSPRVYSGHQFGVWAGQLGDGRAMLLGEIDTAGGRDGAAAQGQRPARPTRAWATAARCCARASASSCAPRRCTRWASRPRARWRSSARRSRCGARRSRRPRWCTRVAPSFMRFGHFEHFAHAAQAGGAAALADYVIDALLPRMPRRPRSPCGAAGRGRAAHRAADGAVAGGGLLPWRDEHRQHEHPGPDHRLRPVRFPGRLRPRPHLQPQRRPGPLRLRPPAQRGLLEPAAWRRRCCR